MNSSSWISYLRNIYTALIVSLCLNLIAGCNPHEHVKGNTVHDNQDSCLVMKPDIVSIPSGSALIGSESGYPEERPERQVEIAVFNIDATEVTNAQFSTFIAETGYITSAEKIQSGFNVPGAAVFVPPDISNPNWWRFVEGANWEHPEGPDSTIEGREGEPVVQVSHEDAVAYALWKGRALPTEVQWEYAAKAGSNTRYVWGDNRTVQGVEQANTW